jgi:DNA polymerase-1
MRRLAIENIFLAGRVWDTNVVARVLYNNHFKYSLDECAKRDLGVSKDDEVSKYITKNKLHTKEDIPGLKSPGKLLHFDKVPFDIMEKYGHLDAELVYKLGTYQMNKAFTHPSLGSAYPITRVLNNELKLTKVCAQMEHVGVQLDMNLLATYKDEILGVLNHLHREFKRLTGKSFIDSLVFLMDIFKDSSVKGATEKGNDSLSDSVLAAIGTEVAQIVRDIRTCEKFYGTYYCGFEYYQVDGVIHANMRQAGTVTGRFSYSDPNLQNVPKEKIEFYSNAAPKLDHCVRRLFVPRGGYTFFMLDYDQQEFRMLLDYAGEHELIGKVLHEGVDVHQATADLVGVSRKKAKTLNFALLYGVGKDKLAGMLGVNPAEAALLKAKYFHKLPSIKRFLRQVHDKGSRDLCVHNWYGRICHIDEAKWAYTLPNHIIQGGGADTIKVAMVLIQEYIDSVRADVVPVLQVHDELVFEVAHGQEHHVAEIKKIMEEVYKPFNAMRLTCGVDTSSVNWHDKEAYVC